MRLFNKIKSNDNTNQKRLAVPRVITIMQKCVEHKIQDCFVRTLHFNDLYVLLLSLDIANIKQMLKQQRNMQMKKRNITVQDISQKEAVKFLKGG
ncbi:MAG: hypothetical protein IJ301_04515 [Clostridia bacterium]|nr:hypothetical protein [Clostridia bacterium]